MRSLNSHISVSRLRLFSPTRRSSLASFRFYSYSFHSLKLNESDCRQGCKSQRRSVIIRAFDDYSVDFDASPIDDSGYTISSSEGEESDGGGDYTLNPVSDIDLPSSSTPGNNDALTITAHRFALIGRGRLYNNRIKLGILNNLGLIVFLTVILLFVDWCSWKIVRLPLAPFYLSRPFFISAALVSFAGYLCVPVFNDLKIHQIVRKRVPVSRYRKRPIPTMGGVFFVPIGVGVAKFIAGVSSREITGAAVATLAFAAIGLVDDILIIVKKRNRGLSVWLKVILEVAVGTLFSLWLNSTTISSPYSIKLLIPLPAPLGLLFLGKYYLLLTTFCLVSMGNGVELTDGVDGLAAGVASLAFVGMSIAVLPINAELSILGASMAGACVGFLLHNRYKASICMGETGSLALGAALAAMAACTGMFFPLFVSSGIFILEASSVIMQLMYYKTTKPISGVKFFLNRVAPLHRFLQLWGLKEPNIVTGAYILSCILSLYAGYLGLISA